MKTLTALLVCLSFVWVEGCQSRSTADVDALNVELQAEQARSLPELNQRADQAAAAKAAAEKQVAELSAQLDAAKKQLVGERQDVEKLALRAKADAKPDFIGSRRSKAAGSRRRE